MGAEAELRAELTTFHCKECYVYRPPPASSIGHRAEFWDVDHWLQVERHMLNALYLSGFSSKILARVGDRVCRKLA